MTFFAAAVAASISIALSIAPPALSTIVDKEDEEAGESSLPKPMSSPSSSCSDSLLLLGNGFLRVMRRLFLEVLPLMLLLLRLVVEELLVVVAGAQAAETAVGVD